MLVKLDLMLNLKIKKNLSPQATTSYKSSTCDISLLWDESIKGEKNKIIIKRKTLQSQVAADSVQPGRFQLW